MIAKKCLPVALSPLPFFILMLMLSFFWHWFVFGAAMGMLVQLFFLFFFRDMPRPAGEGIVSPADGRVLHVGRTTVAIFMSLLDMHVNVMPYDGTIADMRHYEGGHAPAYGDVGTNERMEIDIASSIGTIRVVQIAGMVARRIVPYVEKGNVLKKGDRIGIIRFGSRVELTVPVSCRMVVKKGQRIRAGDTVAHLGPGA